MKRDSKAFSVEIKKSRGSGQRHHLLPKRLLETAQAEVAKVFQGKEPPTEPKPPSAPRILPSVIEPAWSSSGPVEPVRHKRSSLEANQGQMEVYLTATASKDVKDAQARALEIAEAVTQTDVAPVVEEHAAHIHDVQPAQGGSVKASSRMPRKKAAGSVERIGASKPMPGPEPIPEAEMLETSVMPSPTAVQRRLTKRLAGAAQLPRNERWKRRLHPASW